jgi:hypothetical protein
MANLKVSCLKKGVVLGRIGEALNELHIQIDVVDEGDLEITRGALGEIKSSLRPLKKNFRTSPEEVRLIDAGVNKIQKLLKGNPSNDTMGFVKAELREIRTNFRKVVGTGFSECGAPKRDAHEIRDLIDDNAWYTDTHPIHPQTQ